MRYNRFTDLVDYRLDIAKQCGADYTLKVSPKDDTKELAQKVIDLLGDRPNITLDCTAFESSISLGLEVGVSLPKFN